jgi:hypothetical protein
MIFHTMIEAAGAKEVELQGASSVVRGHAEMHENWKNILEEGKAHFGRGREGRSSEGYQGDTT